MAWMATVLVPGSPELTETARYHPEEIPLLGAAQLVIPSPWEHGYFWLDPGPFEVVEVSPSFDLKSDAAEAQMIPKASELASLAGDSWSPDRGWYEQEDLGSNADWCDLLEAIQIEDQLMLRGLSKLQTARQLIHLGFVEEAGVAAFVSLEAALEIIRQSLEQEENEKRTLSDVLSYIEEAFGHGPTLRPFLEDLNELRVIAVHPSSRFGEYWTPPMEVDDVYDLMPELVSLYRHVLLDVLPPQDAA